MLSRSRQTLATLFTIHMCIQLWDGQKSVSCDLTTELRVATLKVVWLVVVVGVIETVAHRARWSGSFLTSKENMLQTTQDSLFILQ